MEEILRAGVNVSHSILGSNTSWFEKSVVLVLLYWGWKQMGDDCHLGCLLMGVWMTVGPFE